MGPDEDLEEYNGREICDRKVVVMKMWMHLAHGRSISQIKKRHF